MPILTEQERLTGQEIQLIDTPTEYAFPTSANTVRDYGNIILAQAGLVALNFTIRTYWTGGSTTHRAKLLVGGVPVWTTGDTISRTPTGGAGTYLADTYHALLYLNAGTYGVSVYGVASGGNSVKLCNFKCGFGLFNDLSGTSLATYSSALTHITPVRATPIGNLALTTLYIHVCALTAGAVTNMENIGESLTNGVSVSVDSAQVNFVERKQNGDATYGAYGVATISASAGANHTITIAKDNAATTVYISIIVCPWILGTTTNYPMTQFRFPITSPTISQFSTLYATLEPYHDLLSKFVGVGKSRLVSHGLTRDYYGSETSLEIIEFSYTFEIVDVETAFIVTDGLGGCISYIGVDAK